jgi:hypothetical protein
MVATHFQSPANRCPRDPATELAQPLHDRVVAVVQEREAVGVHHERHVVVAVVVRIAAGGELGVEAGEEAGGSFAGDDDRLDLVATVGTFHQVIAAQVAPAEGALVRPDQDEGRTPPPGADQRVPAPFAVAVLDGAAVVGGEEQASMPSRGE